MRIRKHFLKSLSAATPPPSSDPHGGDHHPHRHHRPLLLVQQQEVHPNGNLQPSDTPPDHRHHPPPPSDHTTQIGVHLSTWVSSGAGSEPVKELKRDIVKINDSGRKESIFVSEVGSNPSIRTPTNAHLVKAWLEGDSMIPIKKRRGSFGKRSNDDLEEDNGMMEDIMKPKTNDKCVASATSPKKNNKKNGKRGNVIMEGSRCSRVNGRGWRCCQQTLVGYSLCEHHLGKGRLRGTTSVYGGRQKGAPKEQEAKILVDHHEYEDEDEDEEEIKDWGDDESISKEGVSKICKKKKLGVVKARSLSSLLSQIGS